MKLSYEREGEKGTGVAGWVQSRGTTGRVGWGEGLSFVGRVREDGDGRAHGRREGQSFGSVGVG